VCTARLAVGVAPPVRKSGRATSRNRTRAAHPRSRVAGGVGARRAPAAPPGSRSAALGAVELYRTAVGARPRARAGRGGAGARTPVSRQAQGSPPVTCSPRPECGAGQFDARKHRKKAEWSPRGRCITRARGSTFATKSLHLDNISFTPCRPQRTSHGTQMATPTPAHAPTAREKVRRRQERRKASQWCLSNRPQHTHTHTHTRPRAGGAVWKVAAVTPPIVCHSSAICAR
jgi:hypothetical protein